MESTAVNLHAMMDLNWVDLLLFMALTATLLIGLGLGFYRQFALTVGVFLGLILAGCFTDTLAASSALADLSVKYGESTARLVAYLLLISIPPFFALLTFFFFPRMFGRVLRSCDTVCGGAAGLSCAVLLFWLVLHCASQYPSHWLIAPVADSYLGSRLAHASCAIAEVLPEEFRTRVERQFSNTLPPPGSVRPGSVQPGSAEPRSVAPRNAGAGGQ